MKNYFVLNQDLTKIQAIDALATILQDESLQLTGEMEKVGLSAVRIRNIFLFSIQTVCRTINGC